MKFIIFIYMIEYVSLIVHGHQSQNPCEGKKNANYSASDVFMYLQCLNQKSSYLFCPVNQIFDSGASRCKDMAGFDINSICKKNNVKKAFLNPWNWNGFIQCLGNIANIFYCNYKSYIWLKKQCVSNFDSFDKNIGFQCASAGKYVNYSIADVFKYLKCSTETIKFSYCPPKQIYDPVKMNCNDLLNYNLSNFCIGRRDGQYRNPWNCHSFISCSGKLANNMSCSPSQLVYNPYENICDYQSSFSCFSYKMGIGQILDNFSGCDDISSNDNDYLTLLQSTQWSQVCKNIYKASFDDNTETVTCKSQDISSATGEWTYCNFDCSTVILNRTAQFCNRLVDSDNQIVETDLSNICGESFILFDMVDKKYEFAVLNSFYEEFEVSFDFNCSQNSEILILSNVSDEFIAVRLNEKLTIFSGSNMSTFEIPILKWNTWIAIKISQQYINNTYINIVSVNGIANISCRNTNPQVISNLSIYHFNGAISNLSIFSKTQVFWSEWGVWSDCDSFTKINRTRYCSHNKWLGCTGENIQIESCNISQVFLTEWSIWSSCIILEGFGIRNRSRNCDLSNVTDYYPGFQFENQECFAFWTPWSNWSSCNISYGIGFKNRTRECNVSDTNMSCSGIKIEIMHCCFNETFKGNLSDANNCCINETFKVFWTQWSDWSSCNIPYVNVLMNRSRECNISNSVECCSGKRYEVKKCYEWSMWSECSSTCGDGYKTQSSLDVGIKVETQTETCSLPNCPVDGMWGNWSSSECSTTCGNGKIHFTRSCNNPLPAYHGQMCMGVNNYIVDCPYNGICPVDGFWNDWSSMSICNQPCNGGFSSKFRICSAPKYGGQYCDGNSTEIVDCPPKPCKNVFLNLVVHFVDVLYQSDYSYPYPTDLKETIKNAISQLYNSFTKNVTFDIELHSMRNRSP